MPDIGSVVPVVLARAGAGAEFELVDWAGSPEEPALRRVHPKSAKPVELHSVFHTLDADSQAESVGRVDAQFHEDEVAGTPGHGVHESPIDLHDVQG